MFPYTNGDPAGRTKCFVSLQISFAVAPNLLSPEVRVRASDSVMLGTAVPEATVDEHGDFRACENQVGAAIEGSEGARIDAIAEPCCMNGATKGEFRFGVAPPVRLHAATDRVTRCP